MGVSWGVQERRLHGRSILFRGANAFLFILLITTRLEEDAKASAWVMEKGASQVITTVTYDIADRSFNEQAILVVSPKFQKGSINIYAEYGLTDWITLRLLPGYEIVQTSFSGERNKEKGFNRTGAGARIKLWSGRTQVVSVEATYFLRGEIRTTETNVLSRGTGDIDLRLLYGISRQFALFKWRFDTFADFQAGYRYRDGAPPNEYHADMTLGVNLGSRWQILTQNFNIVSDGPGELEGQAEFKSFQLHKAQISAVYDVTDRISLQLGGFRTLLGRNIVEEKAGFGAIWVRF